MLLELQAALSQCFCCHPSWILAVACSDWHGAGREKSKRDRRRLAAAGDGYRSPPTSLAWVHLLLETLSSNASWAALQREADELLFTTFTTSPISNPRGNWLGWGWVLGSPPQREAHGCPTASPSPPRSPHARTTQVSIRPHPYSEQISPGIQLCWVSNQRANSSPA